MSNISEIIARHLLSRTSAEEEQLLTSWRKESPQNEATFQRLTDTGFVESEWRKRKAVNWQRAAQQMAARVGQAQRSASWRRPLFRTAAAVTLLIANGAVATYLLYDAESPTYELAADAKPTLRAGTTKAIITLADGTTLDLDKPLSANELAKPLSAHASAQEADDGLSASSVHSPSLSLAVPRGGEFRIELEDGTWVWLNAQSSLVYPESFSATERRVRVEGEAYFKVARNDDKPFYVETAGQVVCVVGTEFNVRSYAEDQTVQTTLVSGTVAIAPDTVAAVTSPATKEGAGTLILSPGHQAVFDKAEGSIKIKSVDTEVVTSWKDGMFVFEDMSLADIMLTLSRWYDFQYEFLDPQAAATIFMGRIPRYSDFADVMEIIELSGGLRLRLTDRHLTIESIRH